jgi:hypothetical protein
MAKADITGRLNLDSTGFERGIQRSKQSVKGFAKSSMATFVRMGAAFAGIGLVKSIVGLGTAAAETASKFEAVFGKAATSMNKKVQELRETIPATTAEIQNSLATFAQMAKAFGMGEAAANQFSVSMTRIAGDLASFHNLEPEEVFTKLSAAISGEFEPLKRLGIVINEARLKQEAFNMGMGNGKDALNANQKALAVQAIVLKDMGAALGDAARTADSAANKIKFLKAEMTETGSNIGITIIPAILELTKVMGGMLNKTKSVMEGIGAITGKLYVSVTNLENGFAGYDGVFSTAAEGAWKFDAAAAAAARETKKLEEEALAAAAAQAEMSSQTNTLVESLEDQEKALKAIRDQVGEYYDKQKEAIDLERKQFIQAKELDVLKLRASGEKAKADALQIQIDKMEKAIEISDKYGVSLKKAANLVENIDRAEKSAANKATSGATGTGGTGGTEITTKPVDDKIRGKIQTGKITTIGSGTRESRFGAMPTMEERERAAGLYLAGGDPMSGRRPSGMKAGEGEKKDKSEQQIEQLKEVNKKLSKLDGALSGDN